MGTVTLQGEGDFIDTSSTYIADDYIYSLAWPRCYYARIAAAEVGD